MTAHAPVYRLTLYAKNADGTDSASALTPRGGSAHAQEFKVASRQGIAGFYPYLDLPRGRRGKIDPIDRKLDKGQIEVRVFDPRVTSPGGNNFTRWATAFFGDADGRVQLLNRKVYIEESLNGGSSWTAFFTGRVTESAVDERLWLSLKLRDVAEELDADIFPGEPAPTVTYAGPTSLLPYGPAKTFGGLEAAPALPGIVRAWSVTGLGSGKYIKLDEEAIETLGRFLEAPRVYDALAEVLNGAPADDETVIQALKDIEVEVTVGASTGRFKVTEHNPTGTTPKSLPFVSMSEGDDGTFFRTVGIGTVPSGRPDFMALPADDAACTFRLIHTGPPRDGAPIYIDTVHPLTLLTDILAGKFGRLNAATHAPLRTFPANAASLAEDSAIPRGRWVVTDRAKMNDWIEEQICVPFHLAYRANAAGEVEAIKMLPPASIGGLPTITQADLGPGTPSWSIDLKSVSPSIRVNYYSDGLSEPRKIQPLGGGTPVFEIAPTFVSSIEHVYEVIDLASPGLGTGKAMEIDASGIRYTRQRSLIDTLTNLGEPLGALAKAKRLAESYRQLLASGVAIARVPCRRTATVANVWPGTVCIVDVDELPDPATNLRGGPRVMRCVERTERGAVVELEFADLGPDSVAVAPSLGAVSLTAGAGGTSISVPVTLNAAGEPAVLYVAVVPIGAARPAETSAAWAFGVRVTASGAVNISGLPSGYRVWPRGRTEPNGESGAKLPSGWVFPSGSGFAETSGITAPSGITAVSGYPTGTEHRVTFTPGNTALPTEVLLDGVLVETLPAGTTMARVVNLAISTAYVLGLRHRATNGGASSTTTHNFSTTGTAAQAVDMVGLDILVGEAG